MADLPEFTSIHDRLPLTTEEIRQLAQPPLDGSIADAEARCRVADAGVIPRLHALVNDGTSPSALQSCLRLAVESGGIPLVAELLSLGVPVNIQTIQTAISEKRLNILSLFLQHGWNLNEPVEWCHPPPLSLALTPDVDIDEAVVSWFLSNGADPNVPCGMDITPLSFAVQFAPLRIIYLLLDTPGRPSNGQLLHHAAWRKSDDCGAVCRLILERGNFGVNDIMYHNHALSFETRKIVGLGTPLHEAARAGRPETAQVLLTNGADITVLNSDGRTALEVARDANNEAVLQFLQRISAKKSNL